MSRTAATLFTAVLCAYAVQLAGLAPAGANGLRWKPGAGTATPDIDPQVYLVLTAGCWERAGSYGRYRLIVIEGGFEEVFHLAYVEVMAVDLERGLETIVKTTPIAEIEDGRYFVTLRDITVAQSKARQCGDAVFEGYIVRRERERLVSERRFRLEVHPDGTYAWSEKAIPGRTFGTSRRGKGQSGSKY